MCLSSNQIRMVFLGNFLIRNTLFVVIGYPDRIYIQNMFQLINILQKSQTIKAEIIIVSEAVIQQLKIYHSLHYLYHPINKM